MSKTLLEPIYKFSNKKVWINTYEDSINNENAFSMMKFTAMRAKTWKKILHEANSFENVLLIFGEKLNNIKDNDTLSYLLL